MDRATDHPRRRRLIIFYALLATFVVIGFVVTMVVGNGLDAERSVAGRYSPTLASRCLGREFELRQSGQFAWISNADGTAGGTVRVSDGEVIGDVECLDGTTAAADLKGAGGVLEGTIGDEDLRADLTGGLSAAEASRTVQPGEVEGEYRLSPTTSCLGGSIELSGNGDSLKVEGTTGVEGTASYADGVLLGQVICQNGSAATFSGDAADRTIRLHLATEDDPATSSEPLAVDATKQRDLSDTVGAFLLATLIVMIVARLFGELAVRLRQPRVMGEVVAGIMLGPSVLGAVAPELQAAVFPSDLVVPLGVAANLGVIFFMFMVGA